MTAPAWRRLVVFAALLAPVGSGQEQTAVDPRAALEDASAAIRAGNYQKALPLAERAVTLAEGASDPAMLATALSELGRARWGRGQYEPALEAQERALALFRERGHRDGEAETLLRVGEVRFSQGRYEEALAAYDRALEANARAASPSLVRESSIRSNIGSALRFLGRLDDAAASADRALALARAAGNEPMAGQALVFLGIVNRARAEYQKAIDAYAAAIEIRRRLGDRRGEAQALGNLGNVYSDLGDYERSIEAQSQSLAIAQEVGYTAQVAFAENNIGTVLGLLGREALPRFERALAAWRTMGRQAEIARTLRQIAAQRLHRSGDAAAARAALDEGLGIARQTGDRDAEGYLLLDLGGLERVTRSPGARERLEAGLAVAKAIGSPSLEFELYAERGRTRLDAGDREGGIADLRASAAIVNDIRSRVSRDDARIAFVDSRQLVFHDLAAALVGAGRHGEALEAAEAGRARAFADILESRQLRARPAERRALDDLRQAIAAPRANAPADADRRDASSPLDRLRVQNEELASLVSADSARLDEIRGTASRLAATLVEYLVTARETLVWVVPPGGDVRVARVEVSEARLAQLSRDILASLDTSSRPPPAGARLRANLREVHRLVVAPIAAWLPQSHAATVVIVPHGPLAQIPFAALEDARGSPMLLRHTLAMAPSISTFRYTAPKRRSTDRGSAYIFAAPQAPRDTGLPALPGSLEEGRRVAARLARFAPTVLTGANASERAAKTTLSSAAYLHFATHGLVSDLRPSNSSIVLAPDGPGGDEDGYLRAAEIYSLDLAADLVVLSGCSTARGRATGDGVFGLTRAFLYAGAPSVVASLWDISDRATAFLMSRFYAELLANGNKAGALRAAQIATRQRYPDASLWAPFMIVGEPR